MTEELIYKSRGNNLVEDLLEKGVIIKNRYVNYFTLKVPIILSISRSYVELVENEYASNEEKGGFFICDYNINDKKVEVVEAPIFLDNTVEECKKCKSYIPNEIEKLEIVNDACNRYLIPLMFHTHCSYNNDHEFICGIDTSIDDQEISREIKISKCNLCNYDIYLPDILIVCHKEYNMIFIGSCGGKVIDDNFDKQKKENKEELGNSFGELIGFFGQLNPGIQILILIGVGYIFFKYRSVSIPMLFGTARLLPFMTCGIEKPNQFALKTTYEKIEILIC